MSSPTTTPTRRFGWARDPEQRRRVSVLGHTVLFAGMKRRVLYRLANKLFEKHYEAGEVIFRAGDPGRALFIVESGEVEILRPAPETPEALRRVAAFGKNTAFGELALMDEFVRSATARATEPSLLLILYRTHFDELMSGEHWVAMPLARNLLRQVARYVRSMGGQYPPAAPAASAPDSTPDATPSPSA
jgi:CRP-like cAMP-binding protein